MTEITDRQKEILELLEKEGLADPERMHVLGEMVKGAAAWNTLRKWTVQWGAALITLAGVVGVIGSFRGWWGGGGSQ
ncbi:hypothetical protein ABWH92_12460 [Ahrensia marina]|uniref:hypothetical protein n=1 Tax=Ahrensia marina TaxID=1514904 RepID=UPI0035CF8C53